MSVVRMLRAGLSGSDGVWLLAWVGVTKAPQLLMNVVMRGGGCEGSGGVTFVKGVGSLVENGHGFIRVDGAESLLGSILRARYRTAGVRVRSGRRCWRCRRRCVGSCEGLRAVAEGDSRCQLENELPPLCERARA